MCIFNLSNGHPFIIYCIQMLTTLLFQEKVEVRPAGGGAGPGPSRAVAAGWSSSTNCSPAASASTGEHTLKLFMCDIFDQYQRYLVLATIDSEKNMKSFCQVPNPEAATMPTQLLPRPMHGRTGGLCQETGEEREMQIKRAINLTTLVELLTWSYDYGHLVKHVPAGQMPRVSCGAQDPVQRDPGLPDQLHTPEVPRAPLGDHWRATRPQCRCCHVEVSFQL